MENIKIKSPINREESKSPLQKAGAFIREARQGRSISIKDLSSSLRIGEEQLEALENGQEDLLPERVFVKAMIRRISEKLNLDTNFILEELQGREISIQKIYENSPKEKKKINLNRFAPLMILISGILGLGTSILVISYIQNFDPNIKTEQTLPKTFEPQ